MASDKKRDDEFFNCDEDHEFIYVSSMYSEEDEVYKYLEEKCKDGTINYSTHEAVYKMLKEAGYNKII